VQFENGRRTRTRAIGSREIRIGRDPSSDWVVAYANVSRHHAAVRPDGERNLLVDLGSSRGVRVNGAPIGDGPHALAPGDVIELSDEVLLLYEEGPSTSSTPWLVTGVAMLVLLVATAGLYLATRRAPPPVAAPPPGLSPSESSQPDSSPSDSSQPGSAPEEAAPTAAPGARGTESPGAGTYPGMPPATVPQRVEFKADSLALAGRWYALVRVRSCGDADDLRATSRAAVKPRARPQGEPG
jgi:predicted component of type VI protein secretion system